MSPKWGVFDWKGCAARAGTRLQWLKLEPMWTLARHVPEGGRSRLERLRGARGDTTATVETGADLDASPSCPRSGGVFDWKGCVARAGTRLQQLKLEPMWTLARHVPEVGRFRLERLRGA